MSYKEILSSVDAGLLYSELSPLEGRVDILAKVRPWLTEKKHLLKQEFLSSGDALHLLAAHAKVMDALIVTLFRLARKETPSALAVIAVGGYGRQELFPYSDIDLFFLHDDKNAQEAEAIAAYILYILWDLGLTVGQSHRSLQETLTLARIDITVRTNLLDARFLTGDEALFGQFQKHFQQEIVTDSAAEFIEKKLAERDQRHKRFGDSRYVLEPNIKEGKGGLRDLHTLWWLARYAYPIADLRKLVKLRLLTREEYRTFAHARDFLCTVRVHLHYLAGHAEERLTFDRQQALAKLMGYTHREPHRAVERFMRRYFASVRMVGMATRIFCALLEEEKKRAPRQRLGWLSQWSFGAFKLEGERLAVRQAKLFERRPAAMLELFRTAQQHGLDIHPRALQLMARNLRRLNRNVQNDKRANAVFLDILLSPKDAEATLRKMSDAGVLGRFIPEFGRVVGQTQFNMYHIYTVDEHTLVAIGILHAIENASMKDELPMATQVMQRIKQKRVLYAALLCHDIAKGRPGDHAELGVAIAHKLALRLGLSSREADTAAWLVKQHLLFSSTALKRDMNEPKTIADFVAEVQSSENLKLLFVLTVADMRAVGSSVWNAWKASLLRELYTRAEQAIGSGEYRLPGNETLRAPLIKALSEWKKEEVDAYLAEASPSYLVALDVQRHAVVARMLKQAAGMKLPVLIDTHHNYERASSEIIVCTHDRPGLFSRLTGAMALAGANITHAKIFTLKNGMAIDVFQVQDAAGDVFDRPDRLAKMSVYIEQALAGDLDLADAFAEQQKDQSKSRHAARATEGQVFVENEASNLYTLIEITGQDRAGLLYQLTQAMTGLGISIVTAHISTYGPQISDVFYVKNNFGMKILHQEKIEEVQEKLLAVINNPAFA